MQVSIDPMVAWGGTSLRRIGAILALAVLGLSVVSSLPRAASAWDQGSAESALWQLLNGSRVNNGLAPLQQHWTLAGLAQWRSRDMVDRGYFSHEVAGTGCEVYCWYDSNGLSYVFGGENIGWNAGWADDDSPLKVHEGFMNSPGHRANVLQPAYTHGAVGAYGRDGTSSLDGSSIESIRMYTQLFMQAADAAPPPPPAPAPVAEPAAPVAPPAPAPVATAASAPVVSATAEPEPVAESRPDEAPKAVQKQAREEGLEKLPETDPLALLAHPRMSLEADDLDADALVDARRALQPRSISPGSDSGVPGPSGMPRHA